MEMLVSLNRSDILDLVVLIREVCSDENIAARRRKELLRLADSLEEKLKLYKLSEGELALEAAKTSIEHYPQLKKVLETWCRIRAS